MPRSGTWRNRLTGETGWGPRDPNAPEDYSNLDWWSYNPATMGDIGPRSRYEEILESLREQTGVDPARRAIGLGASAVGATNWDEIYGLAKKHYASTQDIMPLIQAERGRSGVLSGAIGSSYGPATSLIGTGYRGLQGFRGQDQQRYLRELEMQTQLKMAMMQARAAAAGQRGGGGFLESLLGLAGVAMPFMGLFGGGGGYQSPYNNPRGGV